MCVDIPDDDFCFCAEVKASGNDYMIKYVPVDGNYVISGKTIKMDALRTFIGYMTCDGSYPV